MCPELTKKKLKSVLEKYTSYVGGVDLLQLQVMEICLLWLVQDLQENFIKKKQHM